MCVVLDKQFSSHLPSGVHRPSGVPTPVANKRARFGMDCVSLDFTICMVERKLDSSLLGSKKLHLVKSGNYCISFGVK